MHIAELTAVTFIKNDDDVLFIDLMCRVLLDKCGEFLNGGDNNTGVGIFKLPFQNGSGRIAVGGTFFKSVIFPHGLIVKIFSVNHKQNFINVGKPGGKLRRFERSERFTAACGMPDITSAVNCSVFFVVVGYLNPIENPFGSRNLIGTHDKQHIFSGKDAISGENIENGMSRKKCLGKVNEVGNNTVFSVRPE